MGHSPRGHTELDRTEGLNNDNRTSYGRLGQSYYKTPSGLGSDSVGLLVSERQCNSFIVKASC